MRRLLCLVVVLSFFALEATARPKPKQAPVCIIGAGPTGLTAANRLESKGYETVIFDSQAQVGGKCQAFYENGEFHPLGAAFFSNLSHPNSVRVVNDSGVSATPFFLHGARQEFFFDITNGASFPVPAPTVNFSLEVAAELPRYIALWEQLAPTFVVPGFKNGIANNLTVSTAEWLETNNFPALRVVLVQPLALFGYGDIRVTPMIYTLQYITPDILTAFVGLNPVLFTDFHAVWDRWASKFVKGPIHMSTDVVSIVRSGSTHKVEHCGQKQQYQWPSGGWLSKSSSAHPKDWPWRDSPYGSPPRQPKPPKQNPLECSAVILAFPPTLTNLQHVGLDLTDAEKEVFDPVVDTNYFSSAVKFNLPFGVSYIAAQADAETPPPNNGEPVAVLRLHNDSDIVTAWNWGPFKQFEAESDARAKLQSTLSPINKDPRNATAASAPVSNGDVRAFRKWDYFAHYDSAQLAAGLYAKFNALQGQLNTYYASGFNEFELVEYAIRAGLDVVDSHF